MEIQKNLVIVESPAKAKTIEKFLGEDFKVLSSYGHIRDLKKKAFSVNIEDDYKPEYEVPADKKSVVSELKKAAAKADVVWLASDEDREGEAIAWHLSEVLGLSKKPTKRIVFHEITEPAIRYAIDNPRDIDIHLVDAQQARRVLDRIVGFELSPVLWKRIRRSLSAGRVQSVAVRLIVEREREVNEFVTESTFRVRARFDLPGGDVLDTELNHRFTLESEAQSFLEECLGASFAIDAVTKKPGKRSPAAPFTTSTLQQEAARKLGYSVSQTMRIAQKLYEAGHITYMRTDSMNLSEIAIDAIAAEIKTQWGEDYLKVRHYHTKSKGAQEAHEAIRPTYMSKGVVAGDASEKSLYDLIRKRTIASQMADATIERTNIQIPVSDTGHNFVAQAEVITFAGFLNVYRESIDEDVSGNEEHIQILPPVKVGELLSLVGIEATERYSRPPARYTEASLVRRMEDLGIGRPSTYAPTIQTIQNRGYVERGDKEGQQRKYIQLNLESDSISRQELTEVYGHDRGKLIPTDIGVVVNDFLVKHFPRIVDYNFTADIEKRFDLIAEGELSWTTLIDKFYVAFHPMVEEASTFKPGQERIGERPLGVDPVSGLPVSVRIGMYGPLVQLGLSADDPNAEGKPRFAPLPPDLTLETIDLDGALALFTLPKVLGSFEDAEVTVAIGRFGPYVRHQSKFTALPKGTDPHAISLQDAVDLICAKREADAKSLIKTFAEDSGLEVRTGRFGPYLRYKGANYKLPKDIAKPEELTYDDCLGHIKAAASIPKTKRRTSSRTTGATKRTSSRGKARS